MGSEMCIRDSRDNLAERADTLSREASPGKLKSEKEWVDWHAGLVNMLSIIPGSFGVLLAYVIRKSTIPDNEVGYDSFIEESIAKFPLNGPYFEADTCQVHQLVTSLVQGETSEE